jgi:hemoglobin-like flavoprotein
MTPEQIALVRQTYTKVAAVKELSAATFTARLLEADPSLRIVVGGVPAIDGDIFLDALDVIAKGITDLSPLAERLGALIRHPALSELREEHYSMAAAALLSSLENSLGSEFPSEARDAWIAACTLVATIMIRVARQVPSAV